jgi:hypothetical protein
MHAIWLIFFLVLIFCGPVAVIRSALGCLTLLAMAVGAIVILYWLYHIDQPAIAPTAAVYQTVEPAPTPQDFAPRAILVGWGPRGAPNASRTADTPAVTVRRAELVELPKAPKVMPIRRAIWVEFPF